MKISRKYIALGTVLLAVCIGGYKAYKLTKSQGNIIRTSGKALIGGPFEMIDHNGKTVTDKDFKGKYMLVYFGYTFCPDVCPTELQVMTGALEQLGDKAKNIQPVFVSVDPKRDVPDVMKEYVSNFYPGMIGLTGSDAQVAKMAKLYRVYFAKAAEKGDVENYAMDHSSIMYLMSPNGDFVKHFPYGTDAEKLAKNIATATKE